MQLWRRTWADAIAADGQTDTTDLRRQLDTAAAAGHDVEVEAEMLDALEQLHRSRGTVAAGTLPVVETQHRVVGSEPCHFSAPASLPLDASQSSGRLLMTPTKAIFVGAGRTAGFAWHTVHEVARLERDVVLLRADQSVSAHFRFNTYGDAVVAAHLAQHFRATRRGRL